MWPGRGVDHPPPSRVEVKKRVELLTLLPLWAFVTSSRVDFTLPFTSSYDCQIFLSVFKQIWIVPKDFHKSPQHKIFTVIGLMGPALMLLDIWTDGRTDMKKQIGASRDYANSRKIHAT